MCVYPHNNSLATKQNLFLCVYRVNLHLCQFLHDKVLL